MKSVLCTILLLCMLSLETRGAKIHEDTNESRNILVMMALTPTAPAYKVILDGLRQKLDEAFNGNYNLHLEYLNKTPYLKDSKIPDFNVYNVKYRKIKLDLLICVGVDIMRLIIENADSNIKKLPCVTIDIDFTEFGFYLPYKLNDHTTPIHIRMGIRNPLSSALKLFPETKNLYIICGKYTYDTLVEKFTRIELEKLNTNLNIKYFSREIMDNILQKVRYLPKNSLIFIPSFTMDQNNVPYNNREVVQMISRTANAPIFTYSDVGVGDGAVGGNIVDFREVGLVGGDAAIHYLTHRGAKVVSLNYNFYKNIYDFKMLQKWGINPASVPVDSIILNEDISLFEKYRIFFIAGIAFLLIQTVLIIDLIRVSRKEKQVAFQLRATQKKFKELVREDRILRIGQLTASLSHELNQPLTAILITAQAGIRFIESGRNNPEEIKEILTNIVEDNRRTSSILSSLRGMMRLEKREKEKIEINELIRELLIIYKSELLTNHVRVSLSLPDQPVCAICDGTQIQQVLLNLFSNSITAMSQTPIDKKIIMISVTTRDAYIVVSVKDNGSGIDEKNMEKIFRPFISSKDNGIGIGLSISKTIIEKHKGEIYAENCQDSGAKFSFKLLKCND